MPSKARHARTRDDQRITTVAEKSARLVLITSTSAAIALPLNVPDSIRIAGLIAAFTLFALVDVVPMTTRRVSVAVCVFAGICATWTTTPKGVPSIDASLAVLATVAVLIASQIIAHRQHSPLTSSIFVGFAVGGIHQLTPDRSPTWIGFSVTTMMFVFSVLLLAAIYRAPRTLRLVRPNALDADTLGWLLALRATLVLVFVFLIFSGLVL